MIDVVVISWNRPSLIREMVTKIAERTATEYKVIIIDNGSKDEVIEELYNLKNEGLCSQIVLNKEKWFSYSIVQSLNYVTSDPYIISDGDINPPLLSPKDWISTIIDLSRRYQFGITTTNTQLNSVSILGRHKLGPIRGMIFNPKTGGITESNLPSGRGIVDNTVAEVHCAPLWLAAVTKQAIKGLYDQKFYEYRGQNPDLVYSNLLRLQGISVAMSLKVRGIHTGLGWNRGYNPGIYKDDGPYVRPNIPTTIDGIPIYRKHTTQHWWEMKEAICEREEVDYDCKDFELQRLLMTGIHIYYQYLKSS